MHSEAQYSAPTDILSHQGVKRVLPDPERAARLRLARKDAGFDTAADAARRFHWKTPTYHGHENASRGISNKRIVIYAKAFKVDQSWLLSGIGTPREGPRAIKISGRIGEYGQVDDSSSLLRQDGGAARQLAEPPPILGDYIAYLVEGDHNYPAFFNTDIVYTSAYGPPENAIGRQCVALLADGTRRICILGRGSAVGLFLLMSINASPVPDATVLEAAPVVWIRRG